MLANIRSLGHHATRRPASPLLGSQGSESVLQLKCSSFGEPSLAALKDMQKSQDSVVAPTRPCSQVFKVHICTVACCPPCTTPGVNGPRVGRMGLRPPTLRGQEVRPPRSPGQAFKILLSNVRSASMRKWARCLALHRQGKRQRVASHRAHCPNLLHGRAISYLPLNYHVVTPNQNEALSPVQYPYGF